MFSDQVVIANAQVDQAQAGVEAATTALKDWEAKNKTTDPREVMMSVLQQINQLQQQELSLQAQGNYVGAQSVAKVRAQRQNDVTRLGPLVDDYDALAAARDAAVAVLSDAKRTLAVVKAQQAAADPTKVIGIGSITSPSKASILVGLGVPVAVAGGLRRRPARPRPRVHPAGASAARRGG